MYSATIDDMKVILLYQVDFAMVCSNKDLNLKIVKLVIAFHSLMKWILCLTILDFLMTTLVLISLKLVMILRSLAPDTLIGS